MKNARRLLAAVLTMFGSLGLGSCSGNDISGKLVIGLECNYAPFNWTEKSENDYTLPISNVSGAYADGYDIQIAKKLGADLGMEVVIQETQWESLIPDLQMGVINAVIAGMTDTEEREKSIDFTDEYYHSELVLVVKKEVSDSYTDVISQADFGSFIKGKMVVSQTSTVTDDVISIFAGTYGAIHNTPVDTFALAAQDVLTGSAFAMTAELPVANSIVASNSSLGLVHIDQSILGTEEASLGVSIGLKKGNTDLQSKLNASLAKIASEERVTLMGEAIKRSSNI